MNKNFRISSYIVKCEIPSNNEDKDFVVFSTRTGNVISIKESIWDKIKNNKIDEINDNILQSLLDHKIIISQEEEEIKSIVKENEELGKVKTGLSFTIQPTGNCQLGCFYCGQSHTNIKMNEATMEKVYQRITNILEKGRYKHLFITWYGGEPLLALKQIEMLSERLITYCKENNIYYNADIITNGVLLKQDIFKKLVVDCKVTSFQITLDGMKRFHDSRRMTKGGKGSFDVIVKNLKECVNEDIFNKYSPYFNIRLNIDKENIVAVDELINYFHDLQLIDKVGFSFSPVYDWGGNNANKNSIDMDVFSEKEIDWILKIHDLGGKIQVSLPERKSIPCMVGDVNSEVFDAYGNVFPCYELPYTAIYQNENYIEGNLNKSPIVTKSGELRKFSERVEQKTYNDCIDCNFYPVCAGACPKSWMSGDIACPTFKYNIEDKILLYYYLKKSKEFVTD